MKKRAQRKASKPPSRGAAEVPAEPGPLLYKVVELSTVDEASLERTVNTWVQKGWNLDGVQFAMREQSKRPAMAFVFFTREGDPEQSTQPRGDEEAVLHLHRLAEAPAEQKPQPVPVSAYERLRQLAEDDDPERDE